MKTLLRRAALLLPALVAFGLAAPASAQSDPTIVNLPTVSALTGDELLPIYQGSVRVATSLTAACSTKAAYPGSPVVGLPGAGAITGGEVVALYQSRALVASTTAAICSTKAPFAGSPVVGLPGASTLSGLELVPLYQSGRRVTATVAQIIALFGGGPVVATGVADFSDPAGTGLGVGLGLI